MKKLNTLLDLCKMLSTVKKNSIPKLRCLAGSTLIFDNNAKCFGPIGLFI